MNSNDSRAQAILTWLKRDLKRDVLAMQPASSDASFRRYFRVSLPTAEWIVMDAPPQRETITSFINMAAILANAGIKAPRLFHINHSEGFIALEDFGAQTYFDRFSNLQHNGYKHLAEEMAEPLLTFPEARDALYSAAFDTLLTLQKIDTQPLALPVYDRALLTRELSIFYEWFLTAYLQITPPEALQADLNKLLIDSALQQPQVLVHRDFHSRNLMVLETGSPGVLDFQDAVVGPITYDLVSLLKDCYIDWEGQVDVWREGYRMRLKQAGLVTCDRQQFEYWFDLMGLQRHLKAIGIFVRLHLRDGKSSYLQDIPRTMGYVTTVCNKYPELEAFGRYWFEQVIPALAVR